MSEPNVVILTALSLEYDAVRKHLTDITSYRHRARTIFDIGVVPGTSCRIAMACTGPGNRNSNTLAERAISEFSPAALIFSGIAGTLRDLRLGTVVVANKIYGYHGGLSEDDGFHTRPVAWEAPHGIDQLVGHLGRSDSWLERLPDDAGRPDVVSGPLAAGEVVLNSLDSPLAELIRHHYNDAAAVEMEGAGIAQAGHFNAVPTAVVRGISDRADGGKTAVHDRSWQPRAAENAAAFAVELAVHIAKEAEENGMIDRNNRAANITNHHTTNNSTGTVGIQGANVSGAVVNMTPQSPRSEMDPADALKELRTLMERQHQDGAIDQETLDEAAAELDTAETAYPDGPTGRKKAVLALKKLRGIAGDTLDVPAKIGAIVAALNGLS